MLCAYLSEAGSLLIIYLDKTTVGSCAKHYGMSVLSNSTTILITAAENSNILFLFPDLQLLSTLSICRIKRNCVMLCLQLMAALLCDATCLTDE